MAAGFIYLEINTSSAPKRDNQPNGDVVDTERNKNSTTVILADGLGSGIKANIYATMCVSRLNELLRHGFSLRKAFGNVIKTMSDAPSKDLPYTAFSIARVLNNGMTTVLSFDTPPPIIISNRYATLPKQNVYTIGNSIISQVDFSLRPGESILLLSDGITQAGIGKGRNYGWSIEDIITFINYELSHGRQLKDIPNVVRQRANDYWLGRAEDDCTAVLVYCRKGRAANILTGAPASHDRDEVVVRRFFAHEGYKIICGGTTAKIAARVTGEQLSIDEFFASPITPPAYTLKDVDLVTEGAVTLNQLYNILDVEPSLLDKKNPVTELAAFIRAADRINFFVGGSINPATSDISFVQLRILPRRTIIPLIAEKLREKGKLVIIEWI